MALITFVLVVVFGGLTLFFHNDEFIKWKVTVIYALFAGALLVVRPGSEYVTGTATNFAASFSGFHFFRIDR